jgi:hypothetical protein
MSQRNSLNAITDLDDLSHLDELVVDKRLAQRASAKKIGVIVTMKNNSFATASYITYIQIEKIRMSC